MKHELKFAELQTPLFMEGVNHGVKLNPANKGIKLYWDDEMDKLMVVFKNKVSFQPMANVASFTPADNSPLHAFALSPEVQSLKFPVAQAAPAQVTKKPGRPSAQVSTPQSHVFEQPK